MFPFANTANTAPRSLSLDDQAGAQTLYPGSGSFGFITGVVRRQSDASAVGGAHVVAVDSDGNVATSTLSATSGVYILVGLTPGNYTLFAEPFDGPVLGSNLSSDIGGTLASDFSTTFLGGNTTPTVLTVSASATTVAADLNVGGTPSFNSTAASAYPAVCPIGSFTGVAVAGNGFTGSESLSISGSDVVVFSPSFAGGTYSFFVQAQLGAVPGARNFEIRSGSELVIFTGLIEVVEASPVVTNVSPTQGSVLGGTTVTLTGSNFRSGSIVTFGDVEATSVTVDSSTQITAVSPANNMETVEVKVETPDGQLFSSNSITFDFFAQPTIAAVYPEVGQTSGGTTITISGTQFAAGATVTVGGSSATVLNINDTSIVATTPANSSGSAGRLSSVISVQVCNVFSSLLQ